MARRSTPPKYARHSSGQARVRIDGRVQYLGPYGSPESKDAYGKLVADWLRERQTTHRDCPQLTVGKLAVAYMQYAKDYYRKNGQPTAHVMKVRAALRYLTRTYRTLPAAELGPKKLAALRQRLIDRGHARTYINDLIGVVKRLYRWAASEELVPVTAHQALLTVGILRKGRTAAREPAPVRPVPDVLIAAIRDHVPQPVWGLIQFQLTTGCRPGEALIVRGSDLNMSGSIWEYRPASHKTEHHDKSRVVMVGPEGQRVLGGFLRSDLSAYLFSPDPEGARPYRSDSYINAIRRGCEVAFAMPYRLRHPDNFLLQQAADYLDMTAEQRGDLRKRLLTEARKWRREHCWSPGRLRHNFATRARRHAGIEAARVTLGHASAAVTEVYAERDLDVARAVVAKIG